MGDLWTLTRRLCRRTKLEYTFDAPAAGFRIPLRRVVDPGLEIAN